MGEIRNKFSELNTVGGGEVSLDTDIVESLDKLKFTSFLLSDIQNSLIVVVSLYWKFLPFLRNELRMSSEFNSSRESLELDLEIRIITLSIESVTLAMSKANHIINLIVVIDELFTKDSFSHYVVIACIINIQ